jgi:inositol transport system substrate-binding protein
MKKILAILLAILLVLSVVGCASSNEDTANTDNDSSDASTDDISTDEETGNAEDAAYKIGICLHDLDQFLTTLETGIKTKLEELGVEGIQTVIAKEDISTQIGQVETFRNNGYDAVIVGITNGDSASEIINAAGDMKVVFVNRTVNDNSCLDGKNYMYVGMAEYDAGYAQGSWLSEYFKDSGKVELKGVMFMGILGIDAQISRTQGAKDALADNGYNVEWVFEDTAEWDRAKAMDKFTQFAGTGAEFDFVCSNNDEMALGVIESCKASNTEIDFPIVGVDATEVGCMAIKEGTMQMSVNQNGIVMGNTAAQAAVDLVSGKTPEGMDSETNIISTEAEVVTIDNVDDILAVFAE